MATFEILALAPNRSHRNEIAAALEPLGCRVHEGYTSQDMGRIIRETEIDAVVFAGALPGLSAERILTAVAERVPHAVVIVSLPDTENANRLAGRFGGHAVPWPLSSVAVQPLLKHPTERTFIMPRRETRYRIMAGADTVEPGGLYPSLLLNISPSGAMVMSGIDAVVGKTLTVEMPYGAKNYRLSGVIRHTGENANLDEAIEAAPWLALDKPRIFGIEFAGETKKQAIELCNFLRNERDLMHLRVTGIPTVPRSLLAVFKKLGIRVSSQPTLPPDSDPPPIIVADLAMCSLAEVTRLGAMQNRSVIIAVATSPITDIGRSSVASLFSGVFVLPLQHEALVKHIEDFFAPIDRKFPRIEEPFTVLLKRDDGTTLAVDGLNLSLHGCALHLDRPVASGTKLTGVLAMDQAIDAYPFVGEVVYCRQEGGRYRIGLNFALTGHAAASYQQYLSVRFLKELRLRWERQFAQPDGA